MSVCISPQLKVPISSSNDHILVSRVLCRSLQVGLIFVQICATAFIRRHTHGLPETFYGCISDYLPPAALELCRFLQVLQGVEGLAEGCVSHVAVFFGLQDGFLECVHMFYVKQEI